MAVALPKFAAFKHPHVTRTYLEYVHDGPDAGFLKYSSENLVSVYTKFAIEPAKVDGQYFNIRCCYNNKYWATSNDETRMVSAFVDKPQEDKNTSPCTLFHVLDKEMKGYYRLYDVRFQNNVGVNIHSNDHYACLKTQTDVGRGEGIFHFIVNYETVLVMPKHVAFKGNNGKYIQLAWHNDRPYLQFSSDDLGDPNVCNEVFTMSDGSVRIKSNATNKFWRRDPNWILADSNDTRGNDKNTIFWPTKVSKNVIALRNLGNNRYCKRLSTDNKENCLNAAVESITSEAQLELEEPVISREIYNVQFRTKDARIRDKNVLTMATAETTNDGSTDVNVAMQMKYLKTTTKCWNSSMTIGVGVVATLEAGIPFMGKGSISINENFSASYSWGDTLTDSNETSVTYTVNVPAKKRMKVNLVVTNGICDVPFSYTRRDTLKSGEQVITTFDDGIFIGVNPYKFDYQCETFSI